MHSFDHFLCMILLCLGYLDQSLYRSASITRASWVSIAFAVVFLDAWISFLFPESKRAWEVRKRQESIGRGEIENESDITKESKVQIREFKISGQ